MPATADNRIIAIDGLRGLFAVIVVTYHYPVWLGLDLPPPVAAFMARSAIYAVCGFFVISGVSMSIAYRRAPPVDFRSSLAFWIKRFFRIAPLFYFVLALRSSSRILNCLKGVCGFNAVDYGSNLAMVFGFGKAAENSMVVAGWSIGIEWVFYFIFPFIFWLACRSRRSLATLIALAVATLIFWDVNHLATSDLTWVEYAQFPAYFVYFVVGIAIGLSVSHGPILTKWYAIFALVTSIATYVILATTAGSPFLDGQDIAGPGAWLFVIVTCAIVASATQISTASPHVNRCLEVAGQLSYSVYLLHYPVVTYIGKFGLPPWNTAIVSGTVTLILSVFTYHLFERPFIYIGSQLAKKISRPRKMEMA